MSEAEARSSAPPITAKTMQWVWPLLILLSVAALGLVAYLIDEISEGGSFRWDAAILTALRRPGHLDQPIGPVWLTQSAIDLSALGGFTLLWLIGAAVLGFLIYVGQRAEAAWLAASLVGASLLNTVLKLVLHRPRPEVVPHLALVSNASFPSGHAMISAAIYLTVGAMLAEAQPRLSARAYLMSFCVLLVLLIGCSRVYLGVHWPSDVLAGWCFGGLWASAVFAANRLLRRKTAQVAARAKL